MRLGYWLEFDSATAAPAPSALSSGSSPMSAQEDKHLLFRGLITLLCVLCLGGAAVVQSAEPAAANAAAEALFARVARIPQQYRDHVVLGAVDLVRAHKHACAKHTVAVPFAIYPPSHSNGRESKLPKA